MMVGLPSAGNGGQPGAVTPTNFGPALGTHTRCSARGRQCAVCFVMDAFRSVRQGWRAGSEGGLGKSGEKAKEKGEGAELSEVGLARIHQLEAKKKTGWPYEGMSAC